MSLIKNLKKARNETGISSIYPITHLNSPCVFETKEGFIGLVIGIKGIPFVIEENDTLNALSRCLHQAITRLDERFILYVTTHRKKENIVLDGDFKSPLAKTLNDRYHARFKNKSLYQNNLYLTVILKGDTSDKTGRLLSWSKRLFDLGSETSRSLRREEEIQTLMSASQQLLVSLAKFKPHRLGNNDKHLKFSELLSFLSLIPNAGKPLSFQMGSHFPPIAKSIPETFKEEERYPRGHLGQYITSKRLLFGNYIQFQGATKEDVLFGTILSIKNYPKLETSAVILDPLLRLDSEFIATHSFAPIKRDAALKAIDSQRHKLINAEDLGVSQIAALSVLEDKIASGEALMGHHHNTLLLLAPTISQLEKNINAAISEYEQSGTVVTKETLGLEAAFFAQIPGNHSLIARASLITSHNFTDFCSMHNMQTGFRDGNHLGSAVTLVETAFKTPVFFNYHSKGSKTNPAPGHALMFGSNGAGKTTTMSFFDAQLGRYQGRTFYLDQDRSSKIYILASGNSRYTEIHPKNKGNILMNPLQLPDTDANRTFIKSWFGSLIKFADEKDLPATLTALVSEAVNYNFEQLAKPYRSLTNLVKILPFDFPRWAELGRWLKGSHASAEGEFAWLFDNETDALEFNFDKVGFDVTWLMGEVSPSIATPVYHYLVHRMKESLDGRLTTFNIEEAFRVFKNPFWVEILKDWLPTIRKKNGHFVFATQSPESMLDSALSVVLKTNVPAGIYFPNPKADETIYREHLKLSKEEYRFILTASEQSRLFLYKQRTESIICKLDLSDMQDLVRVLSGNEQSNNLADAIRNELGHEPSIWLPEFIKRSAV